MPPEGNTTTITVNDGVVEIVLLPDQRRRVTLKPNSPDLFIPRRQFDTTLPEACIHILLPQSFAWLCDALARHDDPEYVRKHLHAQMHAYFQPSDFAGKRILDFGCGQGASTMIMGDMFPLAEVVGVELEADNVRLANQLRDARQLTNVKFLLSPTPNSLPDGIGQFDYIMLSAVYEHLLPDERRTVMPLLWSYLKPGGALFINQTPYRYYPKEHHTTGLWLLNYFPKSLTHWMANRFARINPEINRSKDWNVLLRGGIRGGTEGEVLRDLRRSNDGKPKVMQPHDMDRAAYWLSLTNPHSSRLLKKCIAGLFRVTDRLLGTIPSSHLDVVIRKEGKARVEP